MTDNIDEMREALIEAGQKVRANASDETIRESYAALQGEDTAPSPDFVPDVTENPEPEVNVSEDPPEEAVTVEDEPPTQPVTPEPPSRKYSKEEELAARMKGVKGGDKNPEVVAWCRDNLTKQEFEERYSGRKY